MWIKRLLGNCSVLDRNSLILKRLGKTIPCGQAWAAVAGVYKLLTSTGGCGKGVHVLRTYVHRLLNCVRSKSLASEAFPRKLP